MRKTIRIAFVATFAAVAGYGIYTSQKANDMSDLMRANMEALASQENSNGNVYCCGNYGDCMKVVGGGVVKGIKSPIPCPLP